MNTARAFGPSGMRSSLLDHCVSDFCALVITGFAYVVPLFKLTYCNNTFPADEITGYTGLGRCLAHYWHLVYTVSEVSSIVSY